MRIVSVLPSATETVFALGRGSDLVGRSLECDYPPEAQRLPVVMRPRTLDSDRPSREIDQRVQSVRGTGESLYELDVALLARLRPEVFLTQDLCGVCSVTEAEVTQACRAAGVAARIVSVQPRTLEEVWQSVETIATAIGAQDAGNTLARDLRAATQGQPTSGVSPRVAVIEWLDPPILAGLWTRDMIHAAGGVPVGPAPSSPSLRLTWDELGGMAPDLVVLSPCSFSVERTSRELRDPALARQVRSLRPGRGMFLADEAYFSRPGPRLAHGVSLLRSLLWGARPYPPLPVRPFLEPSAEVAS